MEGGVGVLRANARRVLELSHNANNYDASSLQPRLIQPTTQFFFALSLSLSRTAVALHDGQTNRKIHYCWIRTWPTTKGRQRSSGREEG